MQIVGGVSASSIVNALSRHTIIPNKLINHGNTSGQTLIRLVPV